MPRKKNAEKKASPNKTKVSVKPNDRNVKFMDFYHNIKDKEEYLGLKEHKRVRYLSERFANETQLNMPVGTIYKLLRAEHIETPVTEQSQSE